MKTWKQCVVALAVIVAGFGVAALPAGDAGAINVFEECESDANSDTAVCKAQGTESISDLVRIIINTLLIIIGMISVVMIVLGGIRYTTSNGEASQVKGAKDTILYAVIGLIVAIMAFAIVNFVVDQF
jgi:heme/copper-type cytochrome/quinol oxidase subunit 2